MPFNNKEKDINQLPIINEQQQKKKKIHFHNFDCNII